VEEDKNPLAVRWDTEHEEADVNRLMKAVSDDVAIYLDRNGWHITMKPACRDGDKEEDITMKPACRDGDKEEDLWPMKQKTTATPMWATDMYADDRSERKIRYRPYPTAVEMPFAEATALAQLPKTQLDRPRALVASVEQLKGGCTLYWLGRQV
jgi:hypothetical protein